VLGDRESTRYEMALAYEAESVVHYMREDLPASLASTEQYRALMAELVASAPENTTYALELVQADNNLGAIAFGLGDTEAAEKHFLASLSSATRLSSEQPDNARFRSTTGGVLVWLGHVAERRDDMVAALEWYARALDEERMAAQTDPQPAYQEPLARTLTILAVAVRSTDPEVSLAYAGEGVELLRSLTSHDPDNANWRQKLHRAMTIDVASRLELGCDAATPHLLEEVRASSADLLTTDEGYIEIHRDRIDADVLLARWMAGTGDYPGAAGITVWLREVAESDDSAAAALTRRAAQATANAARC
jgi:tetratricopeptide (TPR) repeat protein